jgi:hypothetical protein
LLKAIILPEPELRNVKMPDFSDAIRRIAASTREPQEPQDHRDDENGGQNSHPPFGVEVEAGALNRS